MDLKPTPQQATIIEFIRDNPEVNLEIEAVAGAAKTTTLELAAEHIGIIHSPLAVAFNKKIADTLAERLPPHFQCRTLNALGHQAWSQARGGKRLIVDADKNYKLVKSQVPADALEKNEDLFVEVLALLRAAKSAGLVPSGQPSMFRGLIEDHPDNWDELGFAKGLFEVTDEGIFWARACLTKSIAAAFMGEIDYDDQIYMSVLFGGVYPKFHTVLVDEAQDLSAMNHLQLKKLTATRLIAVGDPYQAIYAFRGADSNSMHTLAQMMGEGLSGAVLRSLEDKARDNLISPEVVRNSLIGKGKFKRLTLTNSFRVPKSIGRRQTEWVPHFDSMDWLPEGKVEVWPNRSMKEGDADSVQQHPSWSIHDIPSHGAVLCRNNAPLMKLAFAFIKEKKPVKILGRDMGASLATLLLKITGKSPRPVTECWDLLEKWKTEEIAKLGDSESKQEAIYDRYEALFVLLESAGKETNVDAADFIRDLFTDKAGEQKLTLASGHRAKGLEWDWVMHLDPWRIPSKHAVKAERRGDDGPMTQERNLNYVIETRSKGTLVMASVSDCEEIGE